MCHRITFLLLTLLLSSPLAAQNWDLRLEVPFPEGQGLYGTMIKGTAELVSGDLDRGNGAILSVQHRLIRVGPVLRLDWGGEFSYLTASGANQMNAIPPDPIEPIGAGVIRQVAPGRIYASGNSSTLDTRLKQIGIGIGVNAQLWIPFTGICGEIGAIQRFQRYSFTSQDPFTSESAKSDGTIGRLWLRVGARWRLPFVGVHPYLAASYQQPINKDNPVHIDSIDSLAAYFKEQGKGQEFQRMWTFGVGLTF